MFLEYNLNMNEKKLSNEYQLLLYILQDSKDKKLAYILQRLENMKRMLNV